jgi:hypothetical protein
MNFNDKWEETLCKVKIHDGIYASIQQLRKDYLDRFKMAYARHLSDDAVMDAFEAKKLVDDTLTLIFGGEHDMESSCRECILECEKRYRYEIPALHGMYLADPSSPFLPCGLTVGEMML